LDFHYVNAEKKNPRTIEENSLYLVDVEH
jgi:hypothetical protein